MSDMERLQVEYRQRVEYWTAHPPLGLERHLLGMQHEAAERMIVAARTEVLDRLNAGDVQGARKGLNAVNELYLAHRSSVLVPCADSARGVAQANRLSTSHLVRSWSKATHFFDIPQVRQH